LGTTGKWETTSYERQEGNLLASLRGGSLGRGRTQMKQTKEISGLNPKDFATTKVLCEITAFSDGDCLRVMPNTKNQKELSVALQVPGKSKPDDYSIKYLFGKTLNPLVVAFGDDSMNWIGCRMEIVTKPRQYKAKDGTIQTGYDWEFIPDTDELVM